MGRKRAHELQTHRLVSSGAGASAVSTNTFRAPTEPAAGTTAEQDRLRDAGSPQDRRGSRERRRPLASASQRAMRNAVGADFDTVAALQARSVIILIERATYQNVACKKRVACTRTRSHPPGRPYAAYLSPGSRGVRG